MKPWRFLWCLCLLTYPVSATAQKVMVDFDRNSTFPKYKTFTLKEGSVPGNPFASQRIHDAVELQLGSKGFRRAMGSDPDLLVVYHASTHEDISLSTYYSSWGPGWYPYWGMPMSTTATTSVDTQKKGTLAVDVWDAHTKKLLWRGTAQDSISDNPQKNEKKIKKAAAKMFENFPPKPKQ